MPHHQPPGGAGEAGAQAGAPGPGIPPLGQSKHIPAHLHSVSCLFPAASLTSAVLQKQAHQGLN